MVPRRKLWTREEVAFFESHEAFAGKHYELIEGELLDRMGKKPPHLYVLRQLVLALGDLFGARRILHEANVEVAIADRPTSLPEPDVVALTQNFDAFLGRYVEPHEIALVVEVSDTSLAFDLRTKARLYARAAIAEYWVVDINARCVIVHREPVEGCYESVVSFGSGERIAPLAALDRTFAVDDAFPPHS